MEEGLPDMEGNFQYTEKSVADSRKGVVLQLEEYETQNRLSL